MPVRCLVNGEINSLFIYTLRNDVYPNACCVKQTSIRFVLFQWKIKGQS